MLRFISREYRCALVAEAKRRGLWRERQTHEVLFLCMGSANFNLFFLFQTLVRQITHGHGALMHPDTHYPFRIASSRSKSNQKLPSFYRGQRKAVNVDG